MSIDRRDFLKIAGAHAGLLATGACALPAAGGRPAPAAGAPAIGGNSPDVVVIGAGAFGGWTALHLLQMGARVTLVDAWGPGNSRSTSGDETRGVRTSYGDREHGELWMRWAYDAVDRWKRWDAEWHGALAPQLFFQTGDLIMRADWERFTNTTRELWQKVGVPHQVLPVNEVQYRWPVIRLEDVGAVLYEPGAGVVRARRACQAVAEAFQRGGGTITVARAQTSLATNGSVSELMLSNGDTLRAGTFVYACGPWMGKLFPNLLGQRMRTPMGNVYYFATPPGDHRFAHPNIPSYNFPGITGWPTLPVDNRGFRVRTGGGGLQDPDLSDRWIPAERHERPRNFLAQRFPDLKDTPIMETRACHYELSISRNFIIDRHPDLSNVWLAGGGSAEGFKFGPVVGDYVAKRVLGEEGDPEIAAQFRIPEETYDPPPLPEPPIPAGAGAGTAADTSSSRRRRPPGEW